MKLILSIVTIALLSACSKPNPLTNEQVQMVQQRCVEMGKSLRVFNNSTSSIAYCE